MINYMRSTEITTTGGTDDVSKDLTRSEAREGVPRDDPLSAALDQVNHDYQEKLEEEGIAYLQKVQNPSLEDLFRQSLRLKRALNDLMISV